MTEMVRLDRLAKRFGPVHAVEEVSFTVARGEVLGFLGPNGAGKSTTMRMLTGFMPPTAGTASVLGFDVVRQPIEVKRRVGYLPEGAPLYGDMTALDFLRFVAAMRGLAGRGRPAPRSTPPSPAPSSSEVAHRPIETLSKGFKRRVGLAQAIMHDPPVLVLDEPTDGLDPNQKHGVRAADRRDGGREGDRDLDPHPRGGRGDLHPGGDHRPRAGGRGRAARTSSSAARATTTRSASRPTPTCCPSCSRCWPTCRVPPRSSRSGCGQRRGEPAGLPEDGRPIVHEVGELVRRTGLEVDEITVEQGRLDDVFRDLTSARALRDPRCTPSARSSRASSRPTSPRRSPMCSSSSSWRSPAR